MHKFLKIARATILVLIILILFAISAIAILSTALSWDGTCYGFTDGSWACSWTEYAKNEMGWMAIFSIFPLFLLGISWILLTIIHFYTKRKRAENG